MAPISLPYIESCHSDTSRGRPNRPVCTTQSAASLFGDWSFASGRRSHLRRTQMLNTQVMIPDAEMDIGDSYSSFSSTDSKHHMQRQLQLQLPIQGTRRRNAATHAPADDTTPTSAIPISPAQDVGTLSGYHFGHQAQPLPQSQPRYQPQIKATSISITPDHTISNLTTVSRPRRSSSIYSQSTRHASLSSELLFPLPPQHQAHQTPSRPIPHHHHQHPHHHHSRTTSNTSTTSTSSAEYDYNSSTPISNISSAPTSVSSSLSNSCILTSRFKPHSISISSSHDEDSLRGLDSLAQTQNLRQNRVIGSLWECCAITAKTNPFTSFSLPRNEEDGSPAPTLSSSPASSDTTTSSHPESPAMFDDFGDRYTSYAPRAHTKHSYHQRQQQQQQRESQQETPRPNQYQTMDLVPRVARKSESDMSDQDLMDEILFLTFALKDVDVSENPRMARRQAGDVDEGPAEHEMGKGWRRSWLIEGDTMW